ncbi:TPA: hypothetical protein WGR75_001737 [Neisseria meningitidis]|uniref:hypothetical protein n=1 Tax=Neisseria meningitidis TaxID=487 RepID=UPI000C345401|nr:hypothetical protein [Neisseria meningitidis]MCL4979381.1 hypothetical protein [Neisseria meningitidis]MCL5764649.1 hypothetical protein [Neisseria meningitidis]MCL5865522.1 hypothetical protein [Neisseria meningitidis]MCL5916586.1 hypothetical protein [Neisseria meningitidis]MCL6139087.1 hypothetical protein [Neisseria meningitidis]
MFNQTQTVTYPATFLGAKKFKGEIDGSNIDTCSVLVVTPLPAQSGNAVGFTAAQMKFGDSKNFSRLENLKYPCEVMVMVEMTSTGKGMVPSLIDFQVAEKPKG